MMPSVTVSRPMSGRAGRAARPWPPGRTSDVQRALPHQGAEVLPRLVQGLLALHAGPTAASYVAGPAEPGGYVGEQAPRGVLRGLEEPGDQPRLETRIVSACALDAGGLSWPGPVAGGELPALPSPVRRLQSGRRALTRPRRRGVGAGPTRRRRPRSGSACRSPAARPSSAASRGVRRGPCRPARPRCAARAAAHRGPLGPTGSPCSHGRTYLRCELGGTGSRSARQRPGLAGRDHVRRVLGQAHAEVLSSSSKWSASDEAGVEQPEVEVRQAEPPASARQQVADVLARGHVARGRGRGGTAAPSVSGSSTRRTRSNRLPCAVCARTLARHVSCGVVGRRPRRPSGSGGHFGPLRSEA